jgi:hypothetical protein
MAITLQRYNPRTNHQALLDLVKEFVWKSLDPIDMTLFEQELNNRARDLTLRNSIVLAYEDQALVGAGFFTVFKNFLGLPKCEIHQIVVRKEDAYRKGIEEAIYAEMFKYIRVTMNITKVRIYCEPDDVRLQSVLMKMNARKSTLMYYEHELH